MKVLINVIIIPSILPDCSNCNCIWSQRYEYFALSQARLNPVPTFDWVGGDRSTVACISDKPVVAFPHMFSSHEGRWQ